jgi:hypothetical protein
MCVADKIEIRANEASQQRVEKTDTESDIDSRSFVVKREKMK